MSFKERRNYEAAGAGIGMALYIFLVVFVIAVNGCWDCSDSVMGILGLGVPGSFVFITGASFLPEAWVNNNTVIEIVAMLLGGIIQYVAIGLVGGAMVAKSVSYISSRKK
ncbi:MAG: hypothetical protein AUJ37_03875 [Candidatus Magasanikbacteria bacterium CG1_02_41_34]|nr:MAG: hypothetical protein AUJ37_03875 [Candidatus Magasanikbacteria bacterium CG1_02_41_34]